MILLRRCLLTLLALVLPGAPQAIGRRWTNAVLLGLPSLGLGAALALGVGRSGVLGAALDPTVVDRAGWAVVALGALAAISVTETAVHEWAHPAGSVARAAGVAGIVVLAAVPAAAGTTGLWYAGEHSDALQRVFRGGSTRVLPSSMTRSADDADTTTVTRPRLRRNGGSAAVTAASSVPTTAAAPAPIDTGVGRWNVLLLGGDAGKGRSGLRTDSMILLSVDRRTGDTAMVSVPRNLARLPMPPGPLQKRFPKGWTDLANAFYGFVRNNPSLGDGTDQAAEHAVTAAIAEALGVPIDNYVLVDMGGFIDVIDALGGVDVNLSKRIPAPGNPYEAKHGVQAWFGPGNVHLDGTDALAYARSREGDSDYARMARQRCLLASAARQVGVKDILLRYDDLLKAMERSVVSDLSPAEARKLIDLYGKVDRDAIRSLGLVPPLVNTGAPNYDQIRSLVAETLATPAAAASGASAGPATTTIAAPAGGPVTTGRSGAGTAVGRSTTTAAPGTTTAAPTTTTAAAPVSAERRTTTSTGTTAAAVVLDADASC